MKSDGALDEPAPCPTDLRKRLSKHKSCGAQKQDGYGDTDDDIWPERLEPCRSSISVGRGIVEFFPTGIP